MNRWLGIGAVLVLSALQSPNILRDTSDGRIVQWDWEECLWRDAKTGKVVVLRPDKETTDLWRACRQKQNEQRPQLKPKK